MDADVGGNAVGNGHLGQIEAAHAVGPSRHPGGAQLLGKELAVGTDFPGGGPDDWAYVDFFDLREVPAVERTQRLDLDRFEPGASWRPTTKATSASIVRLHDGRALLFVQARDQDKRGWFYAGTRTADWGVHDWHLVANWEASTGAVNADGSSGTPWVTHYQNANFVTECGSGEIYLIAMGNHLYDDWFESVVELGEVQNDVLVEPWNRDPGGGFNPGVEYATLFRLSGTIDAPMFEKVGQKILAPRDALTTCSLHAGGGIYVTKRGEMILYCIPKAGYTGVPLNLLHPSLWSVTVGPSEVGLLADSGFNFEEYAETRGGTNQPAQTITNAVMAIYSVPSGGTVDDVAGVGPDWGPVSTVVDCVTDPLNPECAVVPIGGLRDYIPF